MALMGIHFFVFDADTLRVTQFLKAFLRFHVLVLLCGTNKKLQCIGVGQSVRASNSNRNFASSMLIF